MKKRQRKNQNFWVVDGFVGILALVIYNFLLYLLSSIGIKGIILTLQQTMGYFCTNTFIDLKFSTIQIIFSLIIVFAISFLLGIFFSKIVRKRKNKN